MTNHPKTQFQIDRDRITLAPAFQRACQRYAHEGGSSDAIASAAVLATSNHFANAVANDPEGLIAVIDLARQIWEGEELAKWLTTPSAKFAGQSPLECCALNYGGHKGTGADDVLDFLETVPLP